MTEDDFKNNYKKSFLEAYKSAVSTGRWFSPVPDVPELLVMANERADLAWQEYLKDTGRDSLGK